MAKLRILILTSSTGGGHDARAEAFAEWCFQLYPHDVNVRIEQMLERSSVVNRVGVDFYNWIQTSSPWIHQAFYTFVEGLSLLNGNSVTFGGAYYKKVIQEYKPHLLFSVHDCLNRGYFQLARKILGPENVRCATYCGEFSGGWGYSINWIEPSADLYISRTAPAQAYALKKGIDPDRAIVRGYMMPPRAHVEVIPEEARATYLTEKLGLKPDLFTVFLATGSNGANNHLALLPTLVKHASRCQAIIICGKDQKTLDALRHWRTQHPEFNCYIDGYSKVVHQLTQVSDIIVTRGGTTTCANALHFKCPIIFNAFGGIMPQESLTWNFFRDGAASVKIGKVADFEALIDRWMADPSAYQTMRSHFLALRNEEDPTRVIDELVNLANEVGKMELRRHPYPPANASDPSLTRS